MSWSDFLSNALPATCGLLGTALGAIAASISTTKQLKLERSSRQYEVLIAPYRDFLAEYHTFCHCVRLRKLQQPSSNEEFDALRRLNAAYSVAAIVSPPDVRCKLRRVVEVCSLYAEGSLSADGLAAPYTELEQVLYSSLSETIHRSRKQNAKDKQC